MCAKKKTDNGREKEMVTNPHNKKVTQCAKRPTVTVKPQQRQAGYYAGDVCPPPTTKTPQSSIPVNTGGSPPVFLQLWAAGSGSLWQTEIAMTTAVRTLHNVNCGFGHGTFGHSSQGCSSKKRKRRGKKKKFHGEKMTRCLYGLQTFLRTKGANKSFERR